MDTIQRYKHAKKYLKYEISDAIGNIRLKYPVSKTGYKIGDEVFESPGNVHLPVMWWGKITGNDGPLIIVDWGNGIESHINPEFTQLVNLPKTWEGGK